MPSYEAYSGQASWSWRRISNDEGKSRVVEDVLDHFFLLLAIIYYLARLYFLD